MQSKYKNLPETPHSSFIQLRLGDKVPQLRGRVLIRDVHSTRTELTVPEAYERHALDGPVTYRRTFTLLIEVSQCNCSYGWKVFLITR